MKIGIKARNRISNTAIYIILTVLSLIWLLPIAWLVMASLRAEPGAYTTYIIPKGWTISNYTKLFTNTELFNFPRWFANTLLVAILSCIITTMLTLMVAYTYSRLRFKSRKGFMNMSLVLGMFPGFMSMIAIYHFMKLLGLDQSLAALVMVYSGESTIPRMM